MKITSGIMLAVAIAFVTYGYWGAFTDSGNRVYDEMDAMFPFFLLIFGVILLFVFLILIIRRNRKNIK
jgi:tellurite resistance protein TehA-like permease